ncbi:putative peptidyl-prolyl cis-trans isomerase [Hibiscus syriacus]|uniref:Peptidyl-prolyl cis-trans isomerase n=1 Tax=Hibiscus syriacus TaxID=106335 RepID=A0A6A3ANY7_HIBSY|nr:putative peptidyl-prolyl cis-trans isomerase [Hibiscus syriacus]
MATGAAAAKTMLRCVLAGSLVMREMEVERRPYHKNCSCALHNLKGTCTSGCSRVSFSKKKTWRNDCSLSAAILQFSSRSSPVVEASVKSME